MADKEKTTKEDLDLGDEKAPGKKKLIIIIAAVVLLLGVGAGAYFFLLAGDETTEEGAEGSEEAEVAEEDKGPVFYHALDPAFVVNLEGKPSMLQISLQVRVRGEETVAFLKHNDPMIRHQFLSLLSTQDGKELQKRASKEKLQGELLAELQKIMKELKGPDGHIEALYFTAFVTQ